RAVDGDPRAEALGEGGVPGNGPEIMLARGHEASRPGGTHGGRDIRGVLHEVDDVVDATAAREGEARTHEREARGAHLVEVRADAPQHERRARARADRGREPADALDVAIGVAPV